nr:shiga-like toxin II variant chain A - Escherichia coli (strain TB1-pCG6) (fragments) [Escherichia coli]
QEFTIDFSTQQSYSSSVRAVNEESQPECQI